MTPVQLHDLFRVRVDDTVAPFLWSEDEIYRYMDEAQREFVRRTGGISDSSTEAIIRVEFSPNEAFAALSPLILTIRDASRETDGRMVDVFNIEDFKFDNLGRSRVREDYWSPWTAWYRSVGPEWRQRTGSPIKAVIVGVEENKLRGWPIPTESDVVLLDVYRLPKDEIKKSSQCQFEIAQQHHFYLLQWMMDLAYQKQDVDTCDRDKAQGFEDKFVAYCERVWRENERKRHKPRAVAYGGL